MTRSDPRYIDITLRFHFGGLWCSALSAASFPSSEQANICSNSNVTSACRTQFILWKGCFHAMTELSLLLNARHPIKQGVLQRSTCCFVESSPSITHCNTFAFHMFVSITALAGGGVGFKSTGCGVTPPSILFIFFLL